MMMMMMMTMIHTVSLGKAMYEVRNMYCLLTPVGYKCFNSVCARVGTRDPDTRRTPVDTVERDTANDVTVMDPFEN